MAAICISLPETTASDERTTSRNCTNSRLDTQQNKYINTHQVFIIRSQISEHVRPSVSSRPHTPTRRSADPETFFILLWWRSQKSQPFVRSERSRILIILSTSATQRRIIETNSRVGWITQSSVIIGRRLFGELIVESMVPPLIEHESIRHHMNIIQLLTMSSLANPSLVSTLSGSGRLFIYFT